MDQEQSNMGDCVSLSREKGQDVSSQCSLNTHTLTTRQHYRLIPLYVETEPA